MDLALKTDDVQAQIRSLPFWKGPVTLRPLRGGLCNKSFVANDAAGSFVVRIGQDIPVHGIYQSFVQSAVRGADIR